MVDILGKKKLSGVLVVDRYAAYNKAPCDLQYCYAHLLRDVKDLEKEYAVEAILIENLTYKKALELKSTCDIFIDQIGDLGYGINSLESLAMGIPTCSCLAPGFAESYPDHPFVAINAKNLKQELIRLIADALLRQELSQRGRAWVLEHHDAVKSVKKIHALAGIE